METSVKILNLEGKEVESLNLPSVFKTPLRPDVINRVYLALQSHGRQPQGRDPLAGERTSAESGHPPTGRGISRIPRVKGERYSKSGMAGAVASTVHGRMPHPPRSEKVIRKEVNKKERHLALASAIAATADTDLVSRRGHKFSANLPIVVSTEFENIAKVRELKKFLQILGIDKDIERVSNRTKKVSTSLSKITRIGTGPLIVVSNKSKLSGIVKSMEGVSLVKSADISVLDLAPGSAPGRLTIWTKDAIGSLTKNVQNIGA
ncbi:MAG TPA: 50S ribosomal protein L4 [Nitrososphaerales archaeon]|nr:50S ribosomal protein L4 [Nitrososphaerales archaeon]